MEISLGILLVLISTLAIIHLVRAQSQEGFISLDCGLPANEPSPYYESSTGLRFSSDATLIQSGKPGRIRANLAPSFLEPYHTLRYFPEGIRNCYNLKVEKGRNHLIRARFVYGNYDGLDTDPKFDLYLGPNLWAKIDLRRQEKGTRKEMLHIPTSNSLQICLVKTGETIPMISTVEIRPMGIDRYITQNGSLSLYYRYYIRESETKTLRYPDDPYDRSWRPYFLPEWTQISTTSDVDNINGYDPPKAALKSAAIPTNVNEPLTIEWTNSTNDQYYVYHHFAEIQVTNETREFRMYLNEKVISNPITPLRLRILTMSDTAPRSCDGGGYCKLQLIRTNRSTLPPLLNAWEVYTVIHLQQSDTDENDVVAIKAIEATYGLTRISWQGDPCVPLLFMWDGLNCSNSKISTPPRITFLNLSSSGLNGTIAAALQNFTQLEILDLSNNNLTGGVPEFLGNMKSLSFINLRGNNMSGSIPKALQRKGLELSIDGYPGLCLSDSCRKSTKKTVLVVVASVVSAAFIAVLIVFLILRKKKSTIVQGTHIPPRTSTENVSIANNKGKRFKYSEVLKMTNNFERVLGKGGFGMVYHGTVNGSEQVAVKLLSETSSQGLKEFKAEVDLLLRVHHTNLVSLVGYCNEVGHLALIYEFLPNGDLKQHLSGKGDKCIFNWSTRLRIALEAAQGLEYLHIGCKPPMVHRDVKTANILLDENFVAKIGDFGLSRSFQDSTLNIAGTRGYMDPECTKSGTLDEKSDVYSFGIVLLEMITNQPVINQTSENTLIVQWVGSKVNRGDIAEIMDPNLGKDYDSNSAWRALELAMSCANPSSSNRPPMSQVIHVLKECIACENSGISKNRGLESKEMNVIFDTSVVPRAR